MFMIAMVAGAYHHLRFHRANSSNGRTAVKVPRIAKTSLVTQTEMNTLGCSRLRSSFFLSIIPLYPSDFWQ